MHRAGDHAVRARQWCSIFTDRRVGMAIWEIFAERQPFNVLPRDLVFSFAASCRAFGLNVTPSQEVLVVKQRAPRKGAASRHTSRLYPSPGIDSTSYFAHEHRSTARTAAHPRQLSLRPSFPASERRMLLRCAFFLGLMSQRLSEWCGMY
ncbi:hypothetical protein CERSUDRAFT_119600, partial [Gelatoporia subvermispora B]